MPEPTEHSSEETAPHELLPGLPTFEEAVGMSADDRERAASLLVDLAEEEEGQMRAALDGQDLEGYTAHHRAAEASREASKMLRLINGMENMTLNRVMVSRRLALLEPGIREERRREIGISRRRIRKVWNRLHRETECVLLTIEDALNSFDLEEKEQVHLLTSYDAARSIWIREFDGIDLRRRAAESRICYLMDTLERSDEDLALPAHRTLETLREITWQSLVVEGLLKRYPPRYLPGDLTDDPDLEFGEESMLPYPEPESVEEPEEMAGDGETQIASASR